MTFKIVILYNNNDMRLFLETYCVFIVANFHISDNTPLTIFMRLVLLIITAFGRYNFIWKEKMLL